MLAVPATHAEFLLMESIKCRNEGKTLPPLVKKDGLLAVRRSFPHTSPTNVGGGLLQIGLPLQICRFYFTLSVYFLFNGGRNVLLKGCPCILSSPKLIGLEHLLAHSPGLIGMKHKHMERRRVLLLD